MSQFENGGEIPAKTGEKESEGGLRLELTYGVEDSRFYREWDLFIDPTAVERKHLDELQDRLTNEQHEVLIDHLNREFPARNFDLLLNAVTDESENEGDSL